MRQNASRIYLQTVLNLYFHIIPHNISPFIRIIYLSMQYNLSKFLICVTSSRQTSHKLLFIEHNLFRYGILRSISQLGIHYSNNDLVIIWLQYLLQMLLAIAGGQERTLAHFRRPCTASLPTLVNSCSSQVIALYLLQSLLIIYDKWTCIYIIIL